MNKGNSWIDGSKGKTDCEIVLTLKTGVRQVGIVNLQWEDVVFDQNLIIAPEIDTKYSPGVPFKNKLLKCLKGNKVFREFFNKDLSEAGIKKDHIVLRGIEASLFRFITY